MPEAIIDTISVVVLLEANLSFYVFRRRLSLSSATKRQVTSTSATPTDDKWTIVSDARVLQMALYGPSDREWPESLQVFETVWRERQVS